ncbi:hypothetical protein D2T29_12830 [Sinirhodobacter populi]|uniref:Uncharacterized protein n=1 Tax=Paenirhodobacter populi TaxID=2306993 RepID=A0A443KCQ5_9RHOB|nr:hypothetical protein [Sinirhodobacter populi]RWR30550.1 hypothetical protein D2T29_12830 [Sinirhodobacter populi]
MRDNEFPRVRLHPGFYKAVLIMFGCYLASACMIILPLAYVVGPFILWALPVLFFAFLGSVLWIRYLAKTHGTSEAEA